MTPERFRKLREVLDRRQPDLTVVLDRVHKPHNLSAILRSCDAVGVLEVHAVWPAESIGIRHLTSGGTRKWVAVRTHPRLEAAVAILRERGFAIVAAHPAAGAVDFRSIDYTRPTALLLGSELTGLDDRAAGLSDRQVTVPMAGMAASLNVSVAAATLLFEAQRQRSAAGAYDAARLDAAAYARILFEWAHPQVAAYCARHGFAYPALDAHGQIAGPVKRPSGEL